MQQQPGNGLRVYSSRFLVRTSIEHQVFFIRTSRCNKVTILHSIRVKILVSTTTLRVPSHCDLISTESTKHDFCHCQCR